MSRFVPALAVVALCLAPEVSAQTPAKVDFARDVQPIFRQNCFGCHGPAKQNNGLRLDRRSSVFKPGTRRVMPGSLENSFLYHRLIGNEFGIQMPPTGPLHPEQVQIIKAWIEQGAEWPDALANETAPPPLNPKAIAMVDLLRRADFQAFDKISAADPQLLNARGPESSTPFMYAVLYRRPADIERMLRNGADPNKQNDAGATALMWAATDLEKTRMLVAHGAAVNARSNDARTPLMVAAGRPGGAPIVKFLLEHGANPNPNANPDAESSPLLEASIAGDADSTQALLDHGAESKGISGAAVSLAAGSDCAKCVELLVARKLDPAQATIALQNVSVLDDPALIRTLIEHGADVNAADFTGRTPLMYAATSDLLPVEQIRLLVEKGAKINAVSQHRKSGDTGLSALDMARQHGDAAVIGLLVKAGASGTEGGAPVVPAVMRQGNTIQQAVAASLPLLQRADAGFMPKTGCFSCHNDSLTELAEGLARKHGFRIDEQRSAGQVKMNAGALSGIGGLLLQGFFVAGTNVSPGILGFALMGLDAEGYKPDIATDTVAMFLRSHQMADGRWAFGPETRPPLCGDTLSQTVTAMRGLQLYVPRVDQATYAKSIRMAAAWISQSQPRTNYDLAWRLQGLAWGGANREFIVKARRALLAVQRPDGGWSDLASMDSSAFTTGLALIALESSGLPVSDPSYQRGVQYLLNTQLPDGSWHVRTRAAGFQPYFESGFPHGVDQWISAASTSLATVALSLAVQPGNTQTAAMNQAAEGRAAAQAAGLHRNP